MHWLSFLITAAVVSHAAPKTPDYTFEDMLLHADGSITSVTPRGRFGNGYFRIDRSSAHALCAVIAAGDAVTMTAENPMYGFYQAVMVTNDGEVYPPRESSEVIRKVRCAPPGFSVSPRLLEQ